MNTNSVIELLTHIKGYKVAEFKDLELINRLRKRNLEVWKSPNNNRYIVTKGYTSEAQLDTWINDQVIISFVYDILPAKYRNNLYFLLILNWGDDLSDHIHNQIMEIEKNYRVCRKYVISTNEDINRVPSLNRKFGEKVEEIFNFDNEFKIRLLQSAKSGQNKSHITEEIRDLVDLYFKQYEEQNEDKVIQLSIQSILKEIK